MGDIDQNHVIKMTREQELNMEKCAEFMARMICKYGEKVMKKIELREKQQQEAADFELY